MSQGTVIAFSAALAVIYVEAVLYITLYQMKSAAKKRFWAHRVSQCSSRPFRQGLKDQMNAMFMQKMPEDAAMKDHPCAA